MKQTQIESVLTRLDKMIIEPKYFTHFAKPVRVEKIRIFEKLNRILLPLSYKAFLERHNGGMILYNYQSEFLQTHADYEMYKGDAIYFLSIEEIEHKYSDLKSRKWKVSSKTASPYPIIPFCSLPNNELLVFVSGAKSANESPVFDAFHEEFPTTWGIVASDFSSFLSAYLDKLGHPTIIGDEKAGLASDYFDAPKESGETPDEVLIRTELELQKDPDYAYYHYERSLAFLKKDNLAEAYQAITKAVELAPKDPFYYFMSGEVLKEAKKYRAALINYDTALKFKPNDSFYLCCRAEMLIKLNKLDAALNDCNKSIELFPDYTLAYMVRKEIYLLMGLNNKADADDRIIDDLEKQDT
jgi:tetratricopeptide (TPR) repeat protein